MDFANATCVTLTDRGLKNFWLSDNLEDQLKARTLCRNCPVRIDCALYVLEVHPTSGIWAGQSFNMEEKRGRPRKVKVSANGDITV
jgi:hypothetical protein